MIFIEDVKDLKKYASFVPALKNACNQAKILFVFKDEKGALADVSFNIDFDLSSILSNSKELEEKLDEDKNAEGYETEILAKDVIAKGSLNCDNLKCENLTIEGEGNFFYLTVKNRIKAKSLKSHCVFCESFQCEKAWCRAVNCVYVKAKDITIDGTRFKNLTYHGLTLAKDVNLQEWDDKKYGFWSDLNWEGEKDESATA